MISGMERIQKTLSQERADRVPVVAELGTITAQTKGVSVRRYVQDGEIIAHCQIAAAENCECDAVIAIADLSVEAEAIGCPVVFPEHNTPYVQSPVLESISDLKKLEVPDPHTKGRMPEILKATRLMKANSNGRIVVAHVLGPMTIASRIMDVEKLLYLIVDKPDSFQQLLDYTTNVSIAFAEALIQEGADCIVMLDPSSSPAVLPPKLFREFTSLAVKRVFDHNKKCSPDVVNWYSVAGPTQAIIEDVEQCNCIV